MIGGEEAPPPPSPPSDLVVDLSDKVLRYTASLHWSVFFLKNNPPTLQLTNRTPVLVQFTEKTPRISHGHSRTSAIFPAYSSPSGTMSPKINS